MQRIDSRFALVGGALLVLGACDARQLGIPRVQLLSRSRDGFHEAMVRNHPSIDPPQQSLWLRDTYGQTVKLRDLAGDQDWCNTVAWSADSSTVAFLVQDARLLVYDVPTRRVRADLWLAAQDGYPSTRDVRELSLGQDGSSVTFRTCYRQSAKCSDLRTTPLPE